jgi:2-polyprenyl-3-methyl-5-hydroxy-6-metoxy-1,4-benzoquinol methylase
MTRAFVLIRKVFLRQVPSRALLWALLNKLNWKLGTGNRRFEFECLYVERPDPWNYKTSDYEHEKYRFTLECVLKWRRATEIALEVGCSIGIFSKMLAPYFTRFVAIDISGEAVQAAAKFNYTQENIQFLRADLRSLDLHQRFDVIICAEVLYLIFQKNADRVVRSLDEHLAPNGIIVFVSGIEARLARPMEYFELKLSSFLSVIHKNVVQDPRRPYQITVFARPSDVRRANLSRAAAS